MLGYNRCISSITQEVKEEKMTTWRDLLATEKVKPYFVDTLKYVEEQRHQGKVIYPPPQEVFNAFKITEFSDVKVVILGQDPYHGPNQAHGLCFSVKQPVPPPPSLVNIYKELNEDIADFTIPNHGDLSTWATQGVLLLNTVLTVEAGKAHSHKTLGWEQFTDVVIDKLNTHGEQIVFLLWGSHAHKKGQFIDTSKHCVLKSVHPSPLSAYRGFFGCKHFSKANKYLANHGKTPINWQLPLT